MQILTLKELGKFKFGTSITDGGFDGIHVGHQKIISETIRQARENGLKSVLVTFRRPPRLFFNPNQKLLTTLEEKLEIIAALGIDYVLLLDFPEIRGLEAEDFIQEIIIDRLNGKRIVIGYNHHFGHGGRGNAQLLLQNIERWRLFITVVPPIFVNGFPVSSTLIRQFVAKGRLEDAAMCLGRPYFVTGEVVRGLNLGSKIGFPTANLDVPNDKLLPANGVYAAHCYVDGAHYPSAVFIGHAKTLKKDADRSVEAHIIGFSGDLYGKKIRLEFVKKLRDEKTFPSTEELKEQINRDVQTVSELLSA